MLTGIVIGIAGTIAVEAAIIHWMASAWARQWQRAKVEDADIVGSQGAD